MMNCANFFGIVTWEQRKLGDIATFINGRAYSKNELLHQGKYKVLRVGNFYTNDSWYYSDMELDKKYYANYGDLLYTWSATFGPHIWKGEKVIYHYHIWKIILSDEITKNFTLQLLEHDKNRLLAEKSGSTMIHLTKKDMENKEIVIPSSTNEQDKVGLLLTKLDYLITLQQRKLSLIEKLRENISEHIFSPDIMKFKNIDPEFEIKKLSDISNIFIGLVTTMTKNYAKNGILLIRNSNIKENNFKFDNYIYLDSKFAEKNKNREMKIGDVVTVHTGDIGTSAVIEPKEENSIGFATITTRPNNKIINSYYLSDYLNTKKHKNWAVRMSTGDGRRNYNLKDFTRIRLNVPSLNYQIKIVALIKYLESFSKSEKKKINQLNSLKQFLLQNLFI